MLTAHEYAIAKRDTAKALDLDDTITWGLLFCHDEHGREITLAGESQAVEALQRLSNKDLAGLSLDPTTFPLRRDGWPMMPLDSGHWPESWRSRV
jgi:hypothetical protein